MSYFVIFSLFIKYPKIYKKEGYRKYNIIAKVKERTWNIKIPNNEPITPNIILLNNILYFYFFMLTNYLCLLLNNPIPK